MHNLSSKAFRTGLWICNHHRRIMSSTKPLKVWPPTWMMKWRGPQWINALKAKREILNLSWDDKEASYESIGENWITKEKIGRISQRRQNISVNISARLCFQASARPSSTISSWKHKTIHQTKPDLLFAAKMMSASGDSRRSWYFLLTKKRFAFKISRNEPPTDLNII